MGQRDRNFISFDQFDWFTHNLVVQKGAVFTAKIFQNDSVCSLGDSGVLTGNLSVRDYNVTLGIPAYHQRSINDPLLTIQWTVVGN